MLPLVLTLALMACAPNSSSVIIAAHRGGMDSGYPENTLAAIGRSAATGVQVIEIDLRATADRHPVVLHDASVDRTTDGRGRVQDLTLAAVQRLRTGNGAGVPTLHDVLTSTRALDLTLLLDLKSAPGLDLGAVARAVQAEYDPARVLFGVRSLADQRQLAATDTALRYLGFVPDPDSIDAFLRAGVSAIRLWPGWIARHPDLIARVKQGGGQIWVTTGSAPVAELERLIALGVDALLTDHPAAAVAALGCRGAAFTR